MKDKMIQLCQITIYLSTLAAVNLGNDIKLMYTTYTAKFNLAQTLFTRSTNQQGWLELACRDHVPGARMYCVDEFSAVSSVFGLSSVCGWWTLKYKRRLSRWPEDCRNATVSFSPCIRYVTYDTISYLT